MCKVRVARIQKFCTKDGPGVRTTVFLQGCPLRCSWCHNPETQSMHPEVMFSAMQCIGCGACNVVCPTGAHKMSLEGHEIDREACKGCGACAAACPAEACEMSCGEMTVSEIMAEVEKDRAFYGREGGITLSGGEPMAQPEACIALLRAARAAGINTAVETSGYFAAKYMEETVRNTDLFLWDVKHTDPEKHRQYTGHGNELIIENLLLADSMGAHTRLRCIIVEGVNTDDKHISAIAAIYGKLRYCEGVELLPYHAYGSSKSVQIGRPDNSRRDWIPDDARMEDIRRKLENAGVTVII